MLWSIVSVAALLLTIAPPWARPPARAGLQLRPPFVCPPLPPLPPIAWLFAKVDVLTIIVPPSARTAPPRAAPPSPAVWPPRHVEPKVLPPWPPLAAASSKVEVLIVALAKL